MLDRLRAVPGVRAVTRCRSRRSCRAASTVTAFRAGPHLLRARQRDRHQPAVVSPNFFDVMEIPIVLGRGFTDRDDDERAESRRDQRGGGAQVLPERESDRPALRRQPRDQRAARNRRRAARREIQQRARRRAADDVSCPTCRRGSATRRSSVRTAGDPLARDRTDARSGQTDRSEPADHRMSRRRSSRSSSASRRKSCSRRRMRCSAGSRCCSRRSVCSA